MTTMTISDLLKSYEEYKVVIDAEISTVAKLPENTRRQKEFKRTLHVKLATVWQEMDAVCMFVNSNRNAYEENEVIINTAPAARGRRKL